MRDCWIDNGSLVPSRSDKSRAISSPLELGHYGAFNRSVVKQFGRTYWSIDDAENAPFYGGDVMTIGIIPPITPPVISAGTAAGTLKGIFKYCITYVINGYESAPGSLGSDYYSKFQID